MSIPRKRPTRQATSSAHPVPGTTEASTPPLPVPVTFQLLITDLDQGSLHTLLAALRSANDPEPRPDQPCICPHCGHRHGGYDQQASTLLDCLAVATDALSTATEAVRTVKDALEREVLP